MHFVRTTHGSSSTVVWYDGPDTADSLRSFNPGWRWRKTTGLGVPPPLTGARTLDTTSHPLDTLVAGY